VTGPTRRSNLSPVEFASLHQNHSPKAMGRLLKAEEGERAELRKQREEAGPIRLWVDDDLVDRQAPQGWHQVTTAWAAIEWLDCGVVVALSLDHDLGDDERFGRGIDVVNWLGEQQEVNDRPLWPEEGITLHTANPYGRDAMARAIKADGGRRFYVAEYRTPTNKPLFRMLPAENAPLPHARRGSRRRGDQVDAT
jgi:hypothetical protein